MLSVLLFAEADFYEPVWSRRIMAEVEEHLPKVWAGASSNALVDSKNRPARTMDEEICHFKRLGLHEFSALLRDKGACSLAVILGGRRFDDALHLRFSLWGLTLVRDD